MTFLEFVARKLMGPPAYGSSWCCPFHDDTSPSFHITPPKDNFPIKYKCFGCGAWGDEFDLLKHFHPRDNYSDRCDRRKTLSREFESSPNSYRGCTKMPKVMKRSAERLALDLAFADLEDCIRQLETEEKEPLYLILPKAVAICEQHKVPLQSLVNYCTEFWAWILDSNERHLQTCSDPDCGQWCIDARAERAKHRRINLLTFDRTKTLATK
jgi:hypothetical protein